MHSSSTDFQKQPRDKVIVFRPLFKNGFVFYLLKILCYLSFFFKCLFSKVFYHCAQDLLNLNIMVLVCLKRKVVNLVYHSFLNLCNQLFIKWLKYTYCLIWIRVLQHGIFCLSLSLNFVDDLRYLPCSETYSLSPFYLFSHFIYLLVFNPLSY